MTYIKNIFNPYKHTKFVPKFPEKYIGSGEIICRSSYEEKFCRWLDLNENVIQWASEEIQIPYINPISKTKRNYYPDFYMKAFNSKGETKEFLIEIKPSNQSRPPRNSKKKNQKTILNENATWLQNQAKWNAAINWCNLHNIEFKIITEKQLFK